MASNSRSGGQSSSRSVVKPEHRILWSSKAANGTVKPSDALQGFFTRFAKDNLRVFPWRATNVSSFHLLLAEVLLVQTKAEDVAAVWPKLVRKYPTPSALSRARSTNLMKLLFPLGLQNQRTRSLVAIAKSLCLNFRSRVPGSAKELLSIPHIGLYTATAVRCFAFGERLPIVDANVLRVLGRIQGVKLGVDLRRSREAWTLAWTILPKRNSRMHNYGLLDFAAQICTVKRPRCESCALKQTCCFGQKYLAGLKSAD